jgi:ParB family chromosome partitioning protein
MKKAKGKKTLDVRYEMRNVPLSLIDTQTEIGDWDKKELKTRAAYFMLNGLPNLAVNEKENGRFGLLAAERDFYAAKLSGATHLQVRVYAFTEKNAEIFSLVERLKSEDLATIEQAYLMKRLVQDCGLTQDDVSAFVGISRPAVANTLRLLTLSPEVLGLIESGKLSAGHARTLVRVPKEKQYAFAEEAVKREYSVREMERAVKAYLTPPEVLQKENQAKAAAKSAELKAFVERMRSVYRTKVSLIGNDKKGRIYIDYYSPEDLYRFEEFLDMIESFNRE